MGSFRQRIGWPILRVQNWSQRPPLILLAVVGSRRGRRYFVCVGTTYCKPGPVTRYWSCVEFWRRRQWSQSTWSKLALSKGLGIETHSDCFVSWEPSQKSLQSQVCLCSQILLSHSQYPNPGSPVLRDSLHLTLPLAREDLKLETLEEMFA
jgi:hypothetical protein